ncbi:1976_t:CDS:2 [Diversispora eburnea]|uniref:1976_t:CDS:1 n=1 Tax=Diversispora eburnea TaxID=1213867 RepID=A0A9N9CIN0_9GLOM|nr:1976_t:CDS:2 [Diversispora eburnea]
MLIFDYIRNEAIVSNDFKSKRKRQKAIRRADVNYHQPEFRDNTSCDLLRELTCAVCSGLFSFEYLNTVSVQEICLPLLEVNKYLERSFFEIDFVYGHPYIDKSGYKILFNRNGFVKNDDNENPFDLRLCNNCKQSLKAGNTPIFSLANMWIGTAPQCLQKLTIPEQLLISTELTSLSKILPLPVYRLCDHLKVVFVGGGQPSDEQLKKLINHNILYKNVKLDKTALESLPENGVPTALLVTTVMVNVDPEKIEHYTGYTTDPINEYNMNNDLDGISDKEMSNEKNISRLYDPITELRNSGVTYTDNIPISEQERTLKLLEKIIQELTDDKQICSHIILIPHSNVPRNEYTDLSLLPTAFLTLFPYGVGGHEDNFRKYHIPFKQYVKHLLRVHDFKFRHHRSFIFTTFDIYTYFHDKSFMKTANKYIL